MITRRKRARTVRRTAASLNHEIARTNKGRMEPRTQAEMDETDREYERLQAEELANPDMVYPDDPEYVSLPKRKGDVVATFIPTKK